MNGISNINTKAIRNLGIFAHVDAGKTTVTEQLLFAAGAIRSAGSVDKGTSATDSLRVERERGISVRLATASFDWKSVNINIIDTPGHVDFCAEVERSLRALDCAILVISAVEGVQGQTLNLFTALQNLKIPTLIFINKIDRVGSDVARVMAEIQRELSPACLLLQEPVGQGENDVRIGFSWSEKSYVSSNNSIVTTIREAIAEQDDDLLERYLEGELISFAQLDSVLVQSVSVGQFYPVFVGVAKSGLGIEQLLDAIVTYLPAPIAEDNQALSAVVFKIEHDKTLGRLAHMRIFNGVIKPRDNLLNSTRSTDTFNQSINNQAQREKVSQIKRVRGNKIIDIEQLCAGDIGMISGLSEARVGDIYGDTRGIPDAYSMSAPLLTVQAKAKDEAEFPQLAQALSLLSDEDPMLDLQWLQQQGELHLKITGAIQIEVLQALLLERFNLEAAFAEPTVIYKETPKTCGFGYERYWMPKPCWAILKLKIEPGELGSGVVYESKLSVNDIAAKYQNEIEATIPKALEQGIKGWQVTDIKITLVEGEDHNVHTRPGDYIIATPMAIMNGLMETDTVLLEPIMAFTISATNDLLGAITSDINKMRGSFESPHMDDEFFTLQAKVPAATSMDYSVLLASRSGGKAKMSSRLCGYEPCTLAQGQTTHYRGISPLDRDKWILQARGAIR